MKKKTNKLFFLLTVFLGIIFVFARPNSVSAGESSGGDSQASVEFFGDATAGDDNDSGSTDDTGGTGTGDTGGGGYYDDGSYSGGGYLPQTGAASGNTSIVLGLILVTTATGVFLYKNRSEGAR